MLKAIIIATTLCVCFFAVAGRFGVTPISVFTSKWTYAIGAGIATGIGIKLLVQHFSANPNAGLIGFSIGAVIGWGIVFWLLPWLWGKVPKTVKNVIGVIGKIIAVILIAAALFAVWWFLSKIVTIS